MTHRSILAALAAVTLLISAAFAPQKEKTQTAKVPANPVLEVVLGRSGELIPGGDIPEMKFDSVAPTGIRIRDPKGAYIEGFSFTYGERNVYEDSAGNERIMTDYLTEYCLGDTLSSYIAQNIASRTKPGDTAYYDQINIRLPDGKAANGKAMKFVITK